MNSANNSLALVLLCAGAGKRLRPLTLLTPKPLVPVGDHSNIIRTLTILSDTLREAITEIIIVLGYAGIPYFDGLSTITNKIFSKGEVKIIIDSKLRGTAGHLRTILRSMRSSYILLINGDLVLDRKSCEEIAKHAISVLSEGRTDVLIFCVKRRVRFGVIKYDSDGRFIDWVEKPHIDTVAGIYIISKDVAQRILCELSDPVDMNVFIKLASTRGFRVHVSQISGFVEDIGVIEDYLRVSTMLSEGYLR